MRGILRGRMDFYKLRIAPDASSKASTFNAQCQAEILPNDASPIDFIYESEKDVLIGEEVLRLADPQKMGYAIRHPIQANKFNTMDYPHKQMILDDLETIISMTLSDKLGIERKDYKVGYCFCVMK